MKLNKKYALLLFLCFTLVKSEAQFKWPGGAKAAVCFTYDDGLDCQLDVAVPQLDEFNLKGTFFCTGNSLSLYYRMDEWREISKNGHELGNHTLFHPCDGNVGDWVKPEYDLNKYTLEQILTELKTANTLLKAIDGKEERTFAYTCSNTVAGGKDFTDDIQDIFIGARCNGTIPQTMKNYNVYKTPSFSVVNLSAYEMIKVAEEAREKGTIIVFIFHSVGGGYLNVDADQHRKLLEYVAKNKDDYYNATFGDVMKYIKENR